MICLEMSQNYHCEIEFSRVLLKLYFKRHEQLTALTVLEKELVHGCNDNGEF